MVAGRTRSTGGDTPPLRPEHIEGVCQLPPIHRDPFDRVLIAQAIIEDLALVTIDGEIPKYASKRLRVIQ